VGEVELDNSNKLCSWTTWPVRVVALADVFPDRVQQCVRHLKGRFPDQFEVDASRRFIGVDAFEQLLRTETDLIILAASPVFRPVHLQAAIQQRRHTCLLNPISADKTGAEKVVACLQAAEQAGICAQIGGVDLLPESIVPELADGIIGDVTELFSQVTIPTEERRRRSRKESDFEYQLRHSSHHACLTGYPTAKQQLEHARLAQRLLGSALSSCEVLTHRLSAPGNFTSRLRLKFDNGQSLTSHCSWICGQANRQQLTRIVGSICQYDVFTDRLLSHQGQVLKRGSHSPREGSNRLLLAIRNLALKHPLCSSIPAAQTHFAICQSLAEHQQMRSYAMGRA
jgi:hypothetical protein